MIYYDQPLYRPPAEANSIIIQATLGCSFNKCTFCTMYESKNYKQREIQDIFDDIEKLSKIYPNATKMFLADGDALALDTDTLLIILRYSYKKFTKLRRVSIYASAFNIEKKSLDELILLKQNGLTLIYYGIESANYELLKKIKKPISSKKMIASLNKAYEAGMKTSVTVILGLGGKKYSKEHIIDTANLINQVKVTFLSTLQLMLQEDTKMKFISNFGEEFEYLSDKEMLEEQKLFISLLNPNNKVIFRSNHVSNSFALAGTLPKDKLRLLEELDYVLKYYFV